MSVVNKMLNDLEQRDKNTASGHENYRPPEKTKSQTMRVLVYGVLAVVLVLYAMLMWFDEEKSERPKSRTYTISPPADLVATTAETDPGAVADITSTAVPMTDRPVAARPEPAIVDDEESGGERESYANTNQLAEVSIVKTTVDTEQDKASQVESAKSKLAVAPSDGQRKSQYQMLAADALASNDTASAKQLLKRWIEAEPWQVEARKRLAALYYADNQLDLAEQTLRETRRLHKDDASVRLMQARLYEQTGNSDMLWDALSLDSTDPDYLRYRAGLARQQNKPAVALADYKALTQLTPIDVRGWLGMSVVHASLGNRQDAIQGFQRVIQLAKGQPKIQRYAQSQLSSLGEAK